jgi:hypothetical protein
MAGQSAITSITMWAIWVATRASLYLGVTAPNKNGDVGIYQQWYACCLSHGAIPTTDQMWQYPPGTALVLWLPGHLPGGYVSSFVLLAVGCDLAVMLMLRARGRRAGSAAGVWYWVCAVPAIGTVAVTRFDVLPVALSVAAVCLTGRGGVRGMLIGAGAAIKIWPVTLLAGTPPGQWRRELAAAAAVFGGVCALFAEATGSFLHHQAVRGLEVESIAATPAMIWRHAHWAGKVTFLFGSMQLNGGYAAFAENAARVGLVLVVMAVVGWRLLVASGRAQWRPEFTTDAPLAATLLFLVISPVLSPQYLLWALGLAAACLATGRTTQRPVAVAVLAIAVLTQLVFPVWWPDLLSGSALVTAVLVVRNGLLAATAVLACLRILRASRPQRDGQEPRGRTSPASYAATAA